jgi:SAM-dependent methyltransferase
MAVSRASASGDAYDRLAYPGYAYPATHPARLEAVARLFGLRPTPAARSRVLELGCGDGGNLLSLAQALPGASLVGVDAATSAVERGNELARAAGLHNVELRCMDIEALPESGELQGGFDYILSHGVYSWIPPRVRAALLASVRCHLEPMGVAYVSYNAYPGSYLRDMARDILGYHVRDIDDPERKLAAAQELMQTIVAIEEPSPYAQVLRQHMERMLRYSSALLFHDDLAEISTPFYFHEFMEHAAHHRLAFLSEADLFESQMRDVPDSAERLMAGLPDDVLVREQYLDFFKNRMFRQTLLCHEQAPVSRALDESEVEHFWISSTARSQEGESDLGEGGRSSGETTAVRRGATPAAETDAETFATPEGFSMTTTEPLVIATMQALADAWPQSVDFATLLATASTAAGPEVPRELVAARLCSVLLQAHLARIVALHGCPPPLVNHAGERPSASPLARAQCAAGLPAVSSLLHGNIRLEDDLEPKLLPLLDGARDLPELAQALDTPVEDVAGALERLASVGLLTSDELAGS